MIVLQTWDTPNGQKPAILLEEAGAEYRLQGVDLGKGEQKSEAFLALNPNGKIPVLTDGNLAVFESGAILIHLAEKFGRFLAPSGQARLDALAWTYWQVGGLGPMMGQFGFFKMSGTNNEEAIERYLAESLRLFSVLERGLSGRAWLAGDEYSIADMMVFPWMRAALGFIAGPAGERMPELSATRRWIDKIEARPAVQTALAKVKGLKA